MITAYIFENENIDYSSSFLDNVINTDGSTKVDLYGSSVQIKWHRTWNNFPTVVEDGSPTMQQRKLIRLDSDFIEAIHACRDTEGRCLMFFDMNLDVALTEDHLNLPLNRKSGESDSTYDARNKDFQTRLTYLLGILTGLVTAEEQLAYLNNRDLHGMLLLVNALANSSIDVDVWAATQKWPDAEIGRLKDAGFKSTGLMGTLSKPGPKNGGTAHDQLQRAVRLYCERRQLKLEDLFWPEHAKQWFMSDTKPEGLDELSDRRSLPIPHSHHVFHEWYRNDVEKCLSNLGAYLRRILIFGYRNWKSCSAATVEVWFDSLPDEVKQKVDTAVLYLLSNKWFYDHCLKTFVGHGALLSTNVGEKPNVVCFLMPLLAATGPSPWIQSIQATSYSNKFAIEDKSEIAADEVKKTREIVLKSHELFLKLAEDRDTMNVNTISVSIEDAANSTFFKLTLGFPACRKFGTESKSDFLSLTQFNTSVSHNEGSTMKPYLAFQKACMPDDKSKDRSVYSWVLPGAKSGTTEVRIAGVERV